MTVAAAADLAGYEGSRACAPADSGFVERDGVRTWWEIYGDARHTLLLLPTWSIVHSRIWRAQIAYLARHFRVVVFDGRGNGRSDRPLDAAAYQPQEFAADALAVMDATGTDSAVTVSLSMGTIWNLVLAVAAPERVDGAVFIGPSPYAAAPPFPDWALQPYNERLDGYDGFQGQNRWFIRDHYREFVEFWMATASPEPHSTRAIEFGVGMALETTPEVVLATLDAGGMDRFECPADRLAEAGRELRPFATQVRQPVLVLNGELERIALVHWARALAEDTGGDLVVVPGAGHAPGRKPVPFNLALRRFAERVSPG